MTGPHLTAFYAVVGAYLLLVCGIGLYSYRRASDGGASSPPGVAWARSSAGRRSWPTR